MALTDIAIRNSKPSDRPIKLYDSDGLLILIKPDGCRGWRFRYRFGGREKMISFGSYPEVPLKLARERRDQARALIASRVDPSVERQAKRAAREDTFEALAREWLAGQQQTLNPRTVKKRTERFESFVFPFVGKRPIAELKATDILSLLKRIEARGKMETAHRVRSDCSNVFRYAVASSRAERDPTVDLRGAIAAVGKRHRAAITEPRRIGELLRAIDGYQGDLSNLPCVCNRSLSSARATCEKRPGMRSTSIVRNGGCRRTA